MQEPLLYVSLQAFHPRSNAKSYVTLSQSVQTVRSRARDVRVKTMHNMFQQTKFHVDKTCACQLLHKKRWGGGGENRFVDLRIWSFLAR